MNLLLAAVLAAPVAKGGAHIDVSMSGVIEGLRPIALAAAPAGPNFAAAMEDGTVRIMDGKLHKTVRTMAKHTQPAYALAWSADGKWLATGDESASIWIENASTGALLRTYRTHKKGIEKLSFNSDGHLLISTGKDDQVNVYDLTSPKPVEMRRILGKGQNFYGASFCPGSPRLFEVATLAGGMREYDAVSGSIYKLLPDPNGQGMFDLAYVPSGSESVAAGRDGSVTIWDNHTAKKLSDIRAHDDWVMATAVSPNGQLAASSSTDRTVKVWDIHSSAKVAELSQQCYVGSPLCFTADGGTLVTVNDMGFLQFNAISPSCAEAPVAPKTPAKSGRHRVAHHGKATASAS